MATYYMFGKYSHEAIKGISSNRTKQSEKAIEKLGGVVKSMHVLLGKYDLALVVELPGATEAIKASLALTQITGISFTTSEAIDVDEFDQLVK